MPSFVSAMQFGVFHQMERANLDQLVKPQYVYVKSLSPSNTTTPLRARWFANQK